MDANTIAPILEGAMRLALQFAEAYPKIRAGLSTDDRATFDDLFAQMTARSNAVADTLRNTPDDAE